jgi:uncharacterized protein (DUF362 family)
MAREDKIASVVLRKANESSVETTIREILEALHWQDIIQPDSRVNIKLNLSSINPETLQASNTDPAIIRVVSRTFQERTSNITLVESDGMRYSAEEAFEKNGIYQLADELGVEVRNLSREPQIYGVHRLLEGFGLPSLLLEETDVFITLPVVKTHALTVFSGALKNQWGCIPRYDRILLHKHLDELIPVLNKFFKPQLAIMDGIWGMEGRGPTSGKPRYMGVVLGSRYPASLDATAMRLIGLDPYSSRHVVLSAGEELGPIDEDKIQIDGDFGGLKTQFEPAHLDWAVRWMNEFSRYPFFVHKILLNRWLFRVSKSLVKALRSVGVVR